LKELAKRFKAKEDGIETFPKLVSHLKTHCRQWKSNNAIRLLEAGTASSVSEETCKHAKTLRPP
jgi:hypothetical protein